MKKPPIYAKILVVIVLATIAVGAVSFLTPSQKWITGRCLPEIDMRYQGFTISNGDYNISESVNAVQSASIQKILLHGNYVDTYLNSTRVNVANPLNYHLNIRDYLQVNLIMPCTEVCPNQTVGILVFTSQGMYYQEINV